MTDLHLHNKATADLEIAKDKDKIFAQLELQDFDLHITLNGKISRYLLRNKYIKLQSNEHLLKRGVLIGHSVDSVLFVVRILQGREDRIIGPVSEFCLFDTTVVYVSGHTVSTIDICTAEKKSVIECDEPIEHANILICQQTLVVVCQKVLHRLDLTTNLYTKVRLKIDINVHSACVVPFEQSKHITVSCLKGNIYVFDARKMEMIKSMKSFGHSICAITFWKPTPSVLFVLTDNNELIDIDYLNNRLLKRTVLLGPKYTACQPLKNGQVVLFSSTNVLLYSPTTGTLSHVYTSKNSSATTRSPAQIYIIPDISSHLTLEPKPTHPPPPIHPNPNPNSNSNQPTHHNPNHHNPSHHNPINSHPYMHTINPTLAPPPPYATAPPPQHRQGSFPHDPHQATKTGAEIDHLYKSFESFKDSVYKMQTDVLREVFLLKKKLEEIEKTLAK
ncbi:hypothetical protein NEHOM01_2328 [Nematocida homosporus]|uniref:uncharacterized protein n=1 Tax=Nematocida homosporus TaxID=1912981 RepID=UPI00221FCDCD|nr:uncharacterized protein NEHOM01_2328 [Nematocida homosporus]KAI5187731.1 hypothetical protein NEHOM01_2328 [Nematocida homosporus]